MTSGGNNFSRTFQDLKLQFQGLSRTKMIFHDFPDPGILKKKSITFQEVWEPCGLGLISKKWPDLEFTRAGVKIRYSPCNFR